MVSNAHWIAHISTERHPWLRVASEAFRELVQCPTAMQMAFIDRPKASIVDSDVTVSACAVLLVDHSLGGLGGVEVGALELADASVADRPLVDLEWQTTELINIFISLVANAHGVQLVFTLVH